MELTTRRTARVISREHAFTLLTGRIAELGYRAVADEIGCTDQYLRGLVRNQNPLVTLSPRVLRYLGLERAIVRVGRG